MPFMEWNSQMHYPKVFIGSGAENTQETGWLPTEGITAPVKSISMSYITGPEGSRTFKACFVLPLHFCSPWALNQNSFPFPFMVDRISRSAQLVHRTHYWEDLHGSRWKIERQNHQALAGTLSIDTVSSKGKA